MKGYEETITLTLLSTHWKSGKARWSWLKIENFHYQVSNILLILSTSLTLSLSEFSQTFSIFSPSSPRPNKHSCPEGRVIRKDFKCSRNVKISKYRHEKLKWHMSELQRKSLKLRNISKAFLDWKTLYVYLFFKWNLSYRRNQQAHGRSELGVWGFIRSLFANCKQVEDEDLPGLGGELAFIFYPTFSNQIANNIENSFNITVYLKMFTQSTYRIKDNRVLRGWTWIYYRSAFVVSWQVEG